MPPSASIRDETADGPVVHRTMSTQECRGLAPTSETAGERASACETSKRANNIPFGSPKCQALGHAGTELMKVGGMEGESAVFVLYTSFRDNRTPGTRSAMNATQKHAPDSVHR